MAAEITGISDAQLTELTAGGWSDDSSVTPGWRREVKDAALGEEEWQSVFPSIIHPGWKARFGPWGGTNTGSLEEALRWCDNQVGNGEVLSADGSATKQEERFANWGTKNGTKI